MAHLTQPCFYWSGPYGHTLGELVTVVTMPFTLQSLPIDIFFIIIDALNFEDIFNLRKTCRQMKWMLGQGIINQKLVEVG